MRRDLGGDKSLGVKRCGRGRGDKSGGEETCPRPLSSSQKIGVRRGGGDKSLGVTPRDRGEAPSRGQSLGVKRLVGARSLEMRGGGDRSFEMSREVPSWGEEIHPKRLVPAPSEEIGVRRGGGGHLKGVRRCPRPLSPHLKRPVPALLGSSGTGLQETWAPPPLLTPMRRGGQVSHPLSSPQETCPRPLSSSQKTCPLPQSEETWGGDRYLFR